MLELKRLHVVHVSIVIMQISEMFPCGLVF